VAVDTKGDVYVIDLGTDRVLKLDAGANSPTVLPFNDIKSPSSVAVDSKFNVYLNDGLHFRILKLPAR
jgi:DNA-binding beta-propeller fold protein YncE